MPKYGTGPTSLPAMKIEATTGPSPAPIRLAAGTSSAVLRVWSAATAMPTWKGMMNIQTKPIASEAAQNIAGDGLSPRTAAGRNGDKANTRAAPRR